MIHHKFFEEWGFHYVLAEDPFSLEGLTRFGQKLARSAGPEANIDLPSLFDLRAVDLMQDTDDGLRRVVHMRRANRNMPGQNPCAYVVGSLGSFGIMRMYGIFADLEGLRDEALTLVTMDMEEALDWIIGFLDVSAADAMAIRRLVSDLSALTRKLKH